MICPQCQLPTGTLSKGAVGNRCPRCVAEELHGEEDMQFHKSGSMGSIISCMGVTGSKRPCQVPSCDGEIVAFIYRYTQGHKLLFKCDKCKVDMDFGTTFAVTMPGPDPEPGEEAAPV